MRQATLRAAETAAPALSWQSPGRPGAGHPAPSPASPSSGPSSPSHSSHVLARLPRGLRAGYLRMVMAVASHVCGLLVSLLYEPVCLGARLLLFASTRQFAWIGGREPVLQWAGLNVNDDPLATGEQQRFMFAKCK